MQAAPVRFLNAALWPLTIWASLTHFEEHAADDYVERTSPIVATAVAFWICVGLLIAVTVINGGSMVTFGDEADAVAARLTPRWAEVSQGVLWFFTPAVYLVGLWLYAARDEAYPR